MARKIFFRLLFFIPLALILLPPAAPGARAAQVTLAWDAPPDPGVAGYKVYYGTASGSYQGQMDSGAATTCTIPNLTAGIPYYFAATSYSASGQESAYSNEVGFTPSPSCAFTRSPASASFASSGGPGTVSISTAAGCAWTATSNASWLLITSNSAGTGNSTVHYSVAANSSASSRTGTLTVAGISFSVTQAGAAAQYSLTVAKAGDGDGTVTTLPAGTSFSAGTAVSLTAAPDSASAFVGWSGGCSGTSPTCTLVVSSNTSVTATFVLAGYTITASAGSGGTISPSGAVAVPPGGSKNFTITPRRGYQIADVRVNGVSVGNTTSYLFGNVRANHIIEARFTPIRKNPKKSFDSREGLWDLPPGLSDSRAKPLKTSRSETPRGEGQ